MKLNRKEGLLLAAIVLGWALTPLFLFYGPTQLASQTGPIMVAGMLVAAALITRLLLRVARRLDQECCQRLASQGFEVIALAPELLQSWIPMEHRIRPAIRFSGFPDRAGHHTGYQREQYGIRMSLYSYSYYRSKFVFTVARFESELLSWPEFSCAVGSRWSQIYPIAGWERLGLESDSKFSKSCWLQAPRTNPVEALFQAEVRRLVLDHPEFRIFASGPVLMLYTADDQLVPERAEEFIRKAQELSMRLLQLRGA